VFSNNIHCLPGCNNRFLWTVQHHASPTSRFPALKLAHVKTFSLLLIFLLLLLPPDGMWCPTLNPPKQTPPLSKSTRSIAPRIRIPASRERTRDVWPIGRSYSDGFLVQRRPVLRSSARSWAVQHIVYKRSKSLAKSCVGTTQLTLSEV